MTDTTLWLYILLQLDSIKIYISNSQGFLVVYLFIAIVIILFMTIIKEDYEQAKKFKLWIILPTIMFTILGLIEAIIPSTNRAALAIVGAKIIDSNTTSILSNIPEKYAKMLDAKADSYLKETLKDSK